MWSRPSLIFGSFIFLLCVNDLPLVSQFDTILFANNTYLTLEWQELIWSRAQGEQ